MSDTKARAPLSLDDEPEDPEADAVALAALDAEEDRRASRWYCEEPFIGADGREYKCEGRVDHNGGHSAWSVSAKVMIFARAGQAPEIEPAAKEPVACTKCGREMGEHDGTKCPKPYGYVIRTRAGELLCHGRAGGEFRDSDLVGAGNHLPKVFKTKGAATQKQLHIPRVTEIVEWWGAVETRSQRPAPTKEPVLDVEALAADPEVIEMEPEDAEVLGLDDDEDEHASTTPRGKEKKTMETIDTDSAAHSNGALKKAPPKKNQRIELIARDNIEPDPNQPRKTFDEVKLDELAESMKAHGVLVPITVRPKANQSGRYIIIWGERRWRAAEIAGLDMVPSLIADGDDDPAELLERQLIENNQRDDLHPLEEGEAFNTLHRKHGHSVEDLAAKTGKSRSHVYARIAMTKLAPGVKKALLDGRLPHAHSGLIGTIPDPKGQEQCCKEVLGELAPQALRALEDIGVSHESVTDDGSRRVYHNDGKPQVLSFRATAALIRRRYQTRLQLATFDPGDATLTPAGACGPCPSNSGNQPELPGIAAPAPKEGSYCSNLSCFANKTQAAFKRAATAAKAEGKKVFEGKKAEAMFSHGGELKSDTGFAAPDQRLPWNLVNSYDDKFTYKKLLGKHLAEVPTAIVQNDRGAPVEVLDVEKAHEILREHKLLPKKAGASSNKPTAAEKRAKEKAKEEKATSKLREESVPYLVTHAGNAAQTLPAEKMIGLWRMFALFLCHTIDYGAAELYRRMYGDDEEPAEHIGARIEKLKTEPELRALAVELLMIQVGDDLSSGLLLMEDEPMKLASKLLGLDMKKAEKLALLDREQKKVTEAAEKIAEAAKAKKKGGRK